MGGLLAAGSVIAGCAFDRGASFDESDDVVPGVADSGPGTPDATPIADGPVSLPDAAEPDAPVPLGMIIHAPRASTAPVLDAQIEALWNDAPSVDFDIADAELELEDGHPGYSASASVRARFLHDDQKIYLLVEVTDDILYASASSLRHDDGVALFFDGAGDASGPFGADDHTVLINAEATYYDYSENGLTVTGSLDYVADGYVGEYSFAKSEIGGVGDTLGFNLALIDNDLIGNSNVRDAFALWHLPEGPFCQDCCEGEPRPWCDTSMFASLVLDP